MGAWWILSCHSFVHLVSLSHGRHCFCLDYYMQASSNSPVPIRWTAPECLETSRFTTASDVCVKSVHAMSETLRSLVVAARIGSAHGRSCVHGPTCPFGYTVVRAVGHGQPATPSQIHRGRPAVRAKFCRYAFGVLAYEILTHADLPFRDCSNTSVMAILVNITSPLASASC